MITVTDLEITEDAGEEGTLVGLRGRLSVDSSPAFRDLLLATLRQQSPAAVIVDLSEVSYIDASGIATLVEALKIARNRKSTLCLKGLEGRVRHLFEVAGLLTLFKTTGCGSTTSAAKVS
jgi:anti-sigma B factor antagonist